jgi:hypothetical protein
MKTQVHRVKTGHTALDQWADYFPPAEITLTISAQNSVKTGTQQIISHANHN